VARDLGQSGRAAGVEARSELVPPDPAAAHQTIFRPALHFAAERTNVVRERPVLADHEHGAQARYLPAHCIYLHPQ
jgi:hypothetical protein